MNIQQANNTRNFKIPFTIIFIVFILVIFGVLSLTGFRGRVFTHIILISVSVAAFIVCFLMFDDMDKANKRLIALKCRADEAKESLLLERDSIAVMRDNLDTGIFFIDENFLIQDSYSKPLETILSETELKGKNFIDALSRSLTKKECASIQDYFMMIFNCSFDSEMLADINPISEFNYTSVSTGEQKILSCHFTLIEQSSGKKNILCVLKDISRECELRLLHKAEEKQKQTEMRSLFEIIQVDSKAFAEFTEDLEYEFDKAVAALHTTGISTYEMLIDVFQSVHAMKSNAAVLGFANFADSLQLLETEIKKISEKDKIPYEDVMRVTAKLDGIMDEKDCLEAALEKIRAFKIYETVHSSQSALAGNLQRAVEKTAEVQGKKARFIASHIDSAVLDSKNREIIREILMQLVRNAVFHGIESPEERKMLGKDETGTVSLAITQSENAVRVELRDDGRGVDFEAIKQKAIEKNLLKPVAGEIQKEDLIEMLFHPDFSTAERPGMYAGRGIGLNLVKCRIVEAHGSIQLQSQEGKGTVFVITLPENSLSPNLSLRDHT
ncbi:MAG: hypothetical protein Pg6C_11380 [Treponemataceae bacterium]|nr:MAG: hypothetical protein Pg6C_11380 [Treponemataceae bacterium]